jgi:hypothetical protein
MNMSDNEDYRETWFIVPRTILDIQGVTLSYLKVFETIFQFWNKGRKCFLSNPEIARRTGLKVSVIKEAIAFFEKQMELERIQIGMKRYLIQPVRLIEIPGLELVPKEVAANVATCTDVTQVAANVATGGRKRGQVVAANVATEIKNLNKEAKKDKPPISPKGEKKGGFGISEMLENNPFNIPEPILADWMKVRKGKRAVMTETAWTDVIKNVHTISAQGIEPLEIFKIAVRRSWAGIEVRFYKEYLPEEPKKLKYVPKEDRAAEYEKIAARERAAEQRKQEEREAAKGFKDIVKEAKEHVSFKERLRLYELDQERIKNEVDKI